MTLVLDCNKVTQITGEINTAFYKQLIEALNTYMSHLPEPLIK